MLELEQKDKEFAYKAHKGMKRKGKDTPFTYHLKLVNLYLESLTDDEEILAAGWLHDVIEDTPITLEELKKEFNRTVCRYVELETEDKSLPWKDRKLKQINELKENDSKVILIAFADKMANLTEMDSDYQLEKEKLWKRFNRGKDEQHWYYLEFYKIFKESKYFSQKQLMRYENVLANLFE